jgi:hypothetical protein
MSEVPLYSLEYRPRRDPWVKQPRRERGGGLVEFRFRLSAGSARMRSCVDTQLSRISNLAGIEFAPNLPRHQRSVGLVDRKFYECALERRQARAQARATGVG